MVLLCVGLLAGIAGCPKITPIEEEKPKKEAPESTDGKGKAQPKDKTAKRTGGSRRRRLS